MSKTSDFEETWIGGLYFQKQGIDMHHNVTPGHFSSLRKSSFGKYLIYIFHPITNFTQRDVYFTIYHKHRDYVWE